MPNRMRFSFLGIIVQNKGILGNRKPCLLSTGDESNTIWPSQSAGWINQLVALFAFPSLFFIKTRNRSLFSGKIGYILHWISCKITNVNPLVHHILAAQPTDQSYKGKD
jgi:hypothetical protein